MVMGLLKTLIPSLVKGGTKLIQGKQEIRMQEAVARADWEQAAIAGTQNSFKDEFWTLVLGLPVMLKMMGVLVEWLAGSTALTEAADRMLSTLDDDLVGLYGELLFLCISASFGVKGYKGVQRMKALKPRLEQPKVDLAPAKFKETDW